MPEPTVRVSISCTEKVSYHETVTIPASAFAEYEAAIERQENDRWFSNWAQRWLRCDDPQPTGSDMEDVEAKIAVPAAAVL
jgi:hypothetical protein